MARSSHVTDEKIHQAIVVDVTCLATHAKPCDVRKGGAHDVGKCAITIVAVELVRHLEVVADKQVGKPIGVVVPPQA